MSRKKPGIDVDIPAEEETTASDSTVQGYVQIVNLEPSPRDITLYDGSNVRLAQFSRSGTDHISQPILRKLVPAAVKQLATRRWVEIMEVK